MKKNVFHDSDSRFLGNMDEHPEVWKPIGHSGPLVDMSEHGPLSPAVDDDGVNTCEKEPPDSDAPGGTRATCRTGALSGARDGADASKRSARRLQWYRDHRGVDLEGPDHVNGRIT